MPARAVGGLEALDEAEVFEDAEMGLDGVAVATAGLELSRGPFLALRG